MAAFERIGLYKQSCRSEGSIIVTKHPVATAVGSAILDDGGSVIDAAIAAGFVLGVVEPYMSGIGGVGLALVNLGGTMTASMRLLFRRESWISRTIRLPVEISTTICLAGRRCRMTQTS